MDILMFLGWFIGNLVYRKGIRKLDWKTSIIDATGVTVITVILYSACVVVGYYILH